MKYLAKCYKDYSEDEYLLMARKLFNTRKEAEDFIKANRQHVNYIEEIEEV